MTDIEIRIAIAEACGWIGVVSDRWSGYHTAYQPLSTPSDEREGMYHGYVPDYLTDLNAMHEAEKILSEDQLYNYSWHLTQLGPGGDNYKVWQTPNDLGLWEMSLSDCWTCAHATARQRAEAFLRCLGKWRES